MKLEITNQIVKNVIERLIKGVDYRIEVYDSINKLFLKFVSEFLSRVSDAKAENDGEFEEWYRDTFLNPDTLSSKHIKQISIYAGSNFKSINNSYHETHGPQAHDGCIELYRLLSKNVKDSTEEFGNYIRLATVSGKRTVEFQSHESLTLINIIANMRSAINGGVWSFIGKTVEKKLMITLCNLFKVPEENRPPFDPKNPKPRFQVDYYLKSEADDYYACEVKLMGKGNSESVKPVHTHKSKLFVAETLSDKNIKDLKSWKVHWIQLRGNEGHKKFGEILRKLSVPHSPFNGDLEEALPEAMSFIPDDVAEQLPIE